MLQYLVVIEWLGCSLIGVTTICDWWCCSHFITCHTTSFFIRCHFTSSDQSSTWINTSQLSPYLDIGHIYVTLSSDFCVTSTFWLPWQREGAFTLYSDLGRIKTCFTIKVSKVHVNGPLLNRLRIDTQRYQWCWQFAFGNLIFSTRVIIAMRGRSALSTCRVMYGQHRHTGKGRRPECPRSWCIATWAHLTRVFPVAGGCSFQFILVWNAQLRSCHGNLHHILQSRRLSTLN